MCVLVDFPSTLAENLMLQPLRLKLWNIDLFDAVNWQFCVTTCKLKGRKDHGKVCSFVGKVTFGDWITDVYHTVILPYWAITF